MSVGRKGAWGASGGLLATAVMWGSMVPFMSALLSHYDAFTLSVLRYGLALPFMVATVALLERSNVFAGRLQWGRLFILGAAMAAFATFYTLGIRYSDPLTAAVVLTTNPLVGALMARFVGRSSLEPGLVPAIAMAIVGGVLVVKGGPHAATEGWGGIRGGEVLLIFAVSCWAWYTLKAQKWFAAMSNLKVTTLTSATALVWLIAVFLLMTGLNEADWPNRLPDPDAAVMLVWLSWGAAGVAIVLWHRGAGIFGLAVASLYLNLVPVFAFVLSADMFDLVPNAYQIGGGLTVLGSVILMQWRSRSSVRRTTS